MLSDRTLTSSLGLPPRGIALWGDALRGATVGMTVLLVAGFTLVYAQVVRTTVEVRELQDFGIFFDAARQFRAGHDIYASAPGHGSEPLNLNPPHFHLLLWPLSAFSPPTAFAVWMALSAAALFVSLAVVARQLQLGGWAIATLLAVSYVSPAMFAMLLTAQVGAVLMLPFTLAWRRARHRRASAAAAWLGLCASIKPLLLLFVPAYVRLGLRRAALTLTATVLGAFAVGVAVFGIESHRVWLRHLRSITWAEHYMNASLLGLIERSLSSSEWLQHPLADVPSLVTPVWAIAASAVAAATLWRVRTISDVDRQFLLVTTAAMLISPLAWVYYLWFLIPPLTAHLASPGLATGTRWMLLAGVVGLMTPPPLVRAALWWGPGVGTLTAGSAYGWALIVVWLAACREPQGGQSTGDSA